MSQLFIDDFFEGSHVAQSDMQNVANNFAALKSMFSGSTVPTNLTAGMPWFKTDEDQLWIRNAANDDWLSLGFEPGVTMLFGPNELTDVTEAPLGWTRKSDWQDNAMLCYAASGNIAGGGSVNPQNVHTHEPGSFTGGNHNHKWYNYEALSNGQSYNSAGSALNITKTNRDDNTHIVCDTGEPANGGDPHYAKALAQDYWTTKTNPSVIGTSASNTAPHYQEVIACTKD